jgi:hypothetical protein
MSLFFELSMTNNSTQRTIKGGTIQLNPRRMGFTDFLDSILGGQVKPDARLRQSKRQQNKSGAGWEAEKERERLQQGSQPPSGFIIGFVPID